MELFHVTVTKFLRSLYRSIKAGLQCDTQERIELYRCIVSHHNDIFSVQGLQYNNIAITKALTPLLQYQYTTDPAGVNLMAVVDEKSFL